MSSRQDVGQPFFLSLQWMQMSEHAIAWSLGWRWVRGIGGDRQSGVVLRDRSLLYVSVCVCPCRDVQMCVCLASSPLGRQFFPFSQPCVANEQWFDCWLQCEMSAVCLWHVILTGVFFLHHFAASLFVFVKVFICFQYSRRPQQEPLRKPIDHSHFSCYNVDVQHFCPIILGSIAMMNWIYAFLLFFKCPCMQNVHVWGYSRLY